MILDELNLFTFGCFNEGDINDPTLALYTDGWFDVGAPLTVRKLRFDIELANLILKELEIGDLVREPVLLASNVKSVIEIGRVRTTINVATLRRQQLVGKQLRFTIGVGGVRRDLETGAVRRDVETGTVRQDVETVNSLRRIIGIAQVV